jgi:outer membrane protein assembly factor BamB
VGSTPVVYGDLLIAMVGGSPPESQNVAPGRLDRVVGAGSGVVAFNKHTGAVVYRATDELASYASLQLARVDQRDWCFAFARDALIGFDPPGGAVDFRFPWRDQGLESVNAATPVVVGNQVLISETYGPGSALLEFRPGEYDIIWQDRSSPRNKILQCHWCTPVVHEGFIYASSGRHLQNAELRCVDWRTGRIAWSQADLTRGSVLYADDHLIYLGEDGTLRLIAATPERFTLVSELDWQHLPGGAAEESGPKYPAWAPPILSHGLLYVRGQDQLYALELIPQ